MTRLALLADTHVTSYDDGLGEEVAAHLRGVDLILHGGDVYARRVIDWLETFAPVVVARGNGDETLDGDQRVKEIQILEVGGLQIGAVHWFDYPPRGDVSLSRQVEEVFHQAVAVVVFGDTHRAVIDQRDGMLLINPGSPTIPGMRLAAPGTMAILEVHGGLASASLVTLCQPIHLKMHGGREPLLPPPR